MRKQIIDSGSETVSRPSDAWLDLESLARVEITSENPDHPIESALVPGCGPGWRAAQPGKQIIRLVFDRPIELARIHLEFEETKQPRTQEFSLCWSAEGGQPPQEIVRQQYTFSIDGANREIEDYHVNLNGVIVLELEIVPNIGGGAHASLAQMRLA